MTIISSIIQHLLGHHIYTNVDGLDPDIVTAPPVRFINLFLFI